MTAATAVRLCEHCNERSTRRYRRLCHHCENWLGVRASHLPPRQLHNITFGSWRHHAACKNLDVTAWYPDLATLDGRALADHAHRICHHCPVRQSCLDEALRNDEPDGIWGGLDPTQRQQLQARRRAARHDALTAIRKLAHEETA